MAGSPTSRSVGHNLMPATELEKAVNRPIAIGWIRPSIEAKQTDDMLGNTPEKFKLVIKSKRGETLRELEWDSAHEGWSVDIVQIRRWETENLSIELRQTRLFRVSYQTIASGTLTMKEVETALRASQNQLELCITTPQNGGCPKKLFLMVNISATSVLPVWITVITLVDTGNSVMDKTLKSLDLVFKSGQGRTLKNSRWDSSHRYWHVNLPQRRGDETNHLSIQLRRKRRAIGIRTTLATATLTIEESEQAVRESRKVAIPIPVIRHSNSLKFRTEIIKSFAIPPRSSLNVGKLILAIEVEGDDMSMSDMDRAALLRSVDRVLEYTSVITEVLEKLSGKKRELDEQLVDLVEVVNQVYGCAILKDDPLRNYEKFRLLFDTMIQQSVECFLFLSNYISDGYLRHMFVSPQKIDEFTKAFRKLKDHFSDAQQYETTITALEAKHLLVDLRESLQNFLRPQPPLSRRHSRNVVNSRTEVRSAQLAGYLETGTR
ncbi:hypothetical protein V5O48_011056 [Marasmius crinis-equi]|uniref:Uncharacterized protein n=1 Tax=Marasmius crinis-equi TaxID=585013 RepID=A0ABR3F6N8_9AGAR